ncbi:heterokaryon incompatibility, partial [Rhizodiscina lignyota]
RCTLTDVADQTQTTYYALSYTWGEETDRKEIELNGCRFEVTNNLYEFLSVIRDSEGDIQLWIDAICINQFDDLEKARQVERMGDIYRHAE